MSATLLTLAAETAGEEPDQTLFYLCGGLAALWAIALFALGMRSHDFPSSPGAQRGVMLVSVLVVIAATASSVLSS